MCRCCFAYAGDVALRFKPNPHFSCSREKCAQSGDCRAGAGMETYSGPESVGFRTSKRARSSRNNLAEGVPTAAPIAQFGMNQVREQFHAIYDARAGPGEVSVGVHGENAVI